MLLNFTISLFKYLSVYSLPGFGFRDFPILWDLIIYVFLFKKVSFWAAIIFPGYFYGDT